ncbi:CHAD domain-containing protein, partial [Burkholderia territorii]
MSRVLEIVLCLSLEGWPVKAGSRARGEHRDFGAELVRAWRICPQVRMRRGHERVTIEPCQVEEAEPNPGECWWTWIESTAQGRRVVASRTKAFAPGVVERELFDAEHADIAVATPAPVQATDAESSQATGDGDCVTAGAVDEAVLAATSAPAPLRLVSERRRGRWADDSGVVVEMTLDDVTLHGGTEP